MEFFIKKKGNKMMMLECFIFVMAAFIMTETSCQTTEVLAEAGSQAVLPCKCSTLTPSNPAILWTKVNKGTIWRKERNGLQYWGSSWLQNGPARVQCPHSRFERGDYSLQINSLREEDGGLYSCKVGHGENFVESLVTLIVIKVSVSPSDPIMGNTVSLTCRVIPWSSGTSVQWMLNNSPFVSSNRMKSDRDVSVVSERANVRLMGTWTCVARYHGKEGRASATLSVKGIDHPSKDNMKVYAAVGSAVTLPCVFSPGLQPLRPVWEKLKRGSVFKPAFDHLPPSFSPSPSPAQLPWDKSASLNEVGFDNEGKYRCAGTVEGQRLTRTMQLVVAKIVPSKKKGSTMLTCELTDTSEISEYEWVRVTYNHNGTKTVGPIQKGKTLSIRQVSEDTWVEWACRFYGKDGMLGNVTYHTEIMSGLKGQKASGVSHNTAIVIGLSFLLLVLLLILAQMYKNHQRRKRIFQYPALETIVHTISNEREERERNRTKK